MIYRRLLGSVTARLVVMIFVLQALATAGVLVFARGAIQQQSTRDLQAVVGEVRDDLLAWHRRGGDTSLASEIADRLDSSRGENLLLLLVDAHGRQLAGNIERWPPTLVPKPAAAAAVASNWHTIDVRREGRDAPQSVGVIATLLPGGSRLLVGRVVYFEQRKSYVSTRVMTTAFLLALPLMLLIAAATTRLINARIASIAGTALAVGQGDLGSRVPLDGSGDGFDRLGRGVNAMLARIEMLVSELRIVTSGLAHDLRAPIFRLTSSLETAMQATDDPVAQAALDRVAGEAAQLQHMLAMALQISQAEAGIGRDCLAEVDIAEFLGDLAELYEPATEAQGIVLELGAIAEGRFRLHRELVAQAIGNLIDNAMKYAEGADRITLSAAREGGKLLITIADNGVGIAPGDRALALRRFGRLDASRHGNGAGLGLSLVEAVARLHEGELRLGDNAPGLTAQLLLGQDG